jgi:2-polyprenyl-3-methyl-5-hydroxy-6-metoxy-1,4-benzoquinol methylase
VTPTTDSVALCPVCGEETAESLFSTSGDDVARHFFGNTEEPRSRELARHAEDLWGQSTSSFMSCGSCEFAFAHPFVAGDGEFYRIGYGEDAFYPKWKWEFQKTLDVLTTLGPEVLHESATLLDIGAGAGAFVQHVADGLIDRSRITCLEFSETGSDRVRAAGIRCYSADLRDTEPQDFDRAFDIVCLFQVLEHLDGLDRFFERLAEVMQPTGHMFLAIPNPRQRAFLDAYGLHEDLPPAHTGRWTTRPLKLIAERHGFSVVESAIEPERLLVKAFKFIRLRLKRWGPTAAIDRVEARSLRRLLKAIAFPPFALMHAHALFALRGRDMGTSLWVHLKKSKPGES